MALSSSQSLSLGRATSEVERASAAAMRWLKETTGGLTGDMLLNDAERATVKATRDELFRAETWGTTWRKWAEAEWHPDGYKYRLEHHLQVGSDIAKALSFYAKQAYNAGAFNLASDAAGKKLQEAGKAAEQLLADAGDAAKKLAGPWSLATKAGLGVGAAAMLALVLSRVVRS